MPSSIRRRYPAVGIYRLSYDSALQERGDKPRLPQGYTFFSGFSRGVHHVDPADLGPRIPGSHPDPVDGRRRCRLAFRRMLAVPSMPKSPSPFAAVTATLFGRPESAFGNQGSDPPYADDGSSGSAEDYDSERRTARWGGPGGTHASNHPHSRSLARP